MFEHLSGGRRRAAWGADCILIIMAASTTRRRAIWKMPRFQLGMDVLIEVHQEDELERALRLRLAADRHQQPQPADLRDLARRSASGLAPMVPRDRIIVGESGHLHAGRPRRALRRSASRPSSIGESLMRQGDVAAATRTLLARDPRRGGMAKAERPARSRPRRSSPAISLTTEGRGRAHGRRVSHKAADRAHRGRAKAA